MLRFLQLRNMFLDFLQMIFGFFMPESILLGGMIVLQVSKDELQKMMEDSVKKVVNQLPKKRTRPYTKKEVKEIFEISYPTIDRWEAKGLLTRISVSGRVYYSVESVEKLYSEL